MLAEKPSILPRRERTDSDSGKSRPISESLEAFSPVPNCICSVANLSCIFEMTPKPVCAGNMDLLTIMCRYS
jgi:hypothetical protein